MIRCPARVCCQDKLDWLREQIEMRTVGLGWTEVKARWSSAVDEQVGTVEQLTAHVKEVLQLEASRREAGSLPSKERPSSEECPAPLLQRKTFKSLGTPTVQASALCTARTELTSEQLLMAAQKRRADLEAAGEIDWVADRQPYPTGQGPVCDNSLVGKMLEVRWRYRHKETGEPVYIWCEGLVMQVSCESNRTHARPPSLAPLTMHSHFVRACAFKVADGEKDKRSQRCKKLLPGGAVRIQWPADVDFDEEESFVWSILKPCNFNRDVHLGWRYAASELQRVTAENESERCPRSNRGKKS